VRLLGETTTGCFGVPRLCVEH